MTKKDFLEMYRKNGRFRYNAEAERTLNTLLDTIGAALDTHKHISFISWGTWEVTTRSKRKVRNPKTGKKVTVKEKNIIKFRAGKRLKEATR